jgi:hypothetical protein
MERRPKTQFGRELVRVQGALRAFFSDGADRRFVDLNTEENAAMSSIDESILRRINFPNGDLQAVSSLDLHRELTATAGRFAIAEEAQLELLAYAVMASWLPDRTLAAPTVVITAPSRSDLLPIAYFLASVCRNPLTVLKPVEVPLPGSSITTIWDAAAAPEHDVTRFVRSELAGFGLFGGEHVCRRGPVFILGACPDDEAVVPIRLGRCGLGAPSKRDLEEIALTLQPKLLAHEMRVLATNPEIPGLISTLPRGMAVQACALQSATDNPEQHAQIARLIESAKDLYDDDVLLSVSGAVLEVLFLASHNGKAITCGELAEAASELLAQRQQPCEITARRVGSELRQVGLQTKAIEGGRGLVFEPDINLKIHEAAFSLDLPATRSGKVVCEACEKQRLLAGESKPI